MNKFTEREIRQIIQEMSLDHKVGQLFLLAFPGKNPEVVRPLIEKYGIAGCYISQDNGETFAEAEKTASQLQKIAAGVNDRIPLLLGVDQEGAWGVLVPASHTGPGNMALGALPDQTGVDEMYEIFGREMLSAGYNALLGPCSDVNLNPVTPTIGTRSFGEFPEKVAACVEKAVKGAARSGVLTTLKHFPGHGDTTGDSHREIPLVDKPMEELLGNDLLPFIKGIEAGAEIIMTSHILYPQIDPKNPATLSSVILKDLLRKQMSFSGIILSDSMNMGAIKKFYDPAESTLLALKAGVDIVMLSEEHYDHSPDYLTNQIASLETVKNAIIDGRLAIEEVDEKLFRILSVKLNKMKIRTPALNISEIDEIKKFENRIAQKGLTLINRGLWPLPESGPIACVNCSPRSAYTRLMNSRGIGPNQKKPAFDYLREVLEKSNDNFIFISCEEADNGSLELFSRAAAIVAVTEDYPLPGEDFPKEAQEKLVIDLSEKYGDKMIILGLRSSYELSKYPEEVTYLCSFSSRACAARGAGKVLLDRIENPEGTAPVTARTGT